MGSADGLAMAMIAVAGAIGIVAVWLLWSQIRHRSARTRHSHPATLPPVTVHLVGVGGDHRWRIDLRAGAPATSIDIFSYRPRRSGAPWETEALSHPIEISPGGHAIVPTKVVPDDGRYDVVIAWTVHHPDGDLQGSRAFEFPEVAVDAITGSGPKAPRIATVAAASMTAALAVVTALGVAGALERWSDDSPIAVPSGPSVSTSEATGSRPTVPPGTPPTAPDTAPPTSATPSSAPSTSPPPTASVAPATTPAPTTTEAPTTTTPASTTAAPSTTEVRPDGPTVTITGRIGECRFGTDCLVAGFEITGFAARPQEFVCEFEDGSRFTFRFDSGGVEEACATASATAAITIEVEGVRSRTITRADVG